MVFASCGDSGQQRNPGGGVLSTHSNYGFGFISLILKNNGYLLYLGFVFLLF